MQKRSQSASRPTTSRPSTNHSPNWAFQDQTRCWRSNSEDSDRRLLTLLAFRDALCRRLCATIRQHYVEAAPEVPRGRRSVRAPSLGVFHEPLAIRPLPHPVMSPDRVLDAEVVGRHHVGPTQVEHQEHFSSPLADAFHLREMLDNLVVGHSMKFMEVELFVPNVLGEIFDVERFFFRYADGAQF